MKQYKSILSTPGESHRHIFTEYKKLYSDRYHMKRYLNSMNHECQNIEVVNSYIQQKLSDQQT
jgi:hypothetical protein